ncbi:hypothetical protein BGW42_008670 [Actinomortierella wolfii]|nr:hypothetical protein BGW42_008670 [Actinomortierella wolfii]
MKESCPSSTLTKVRPTTNVHLRITRMVIRDRTNSSLSSAVRNDKSSGTPDTPVSKSHLSKRFSILHAPFGSKSHQSGNGQSSSETAWTDSSDNLLPPRPFVDDETPASNRSNSQRYSIGSFKRFGLSLTGGGSRSRKNSQAVPPSAGLRTAATNTSITVAGSNSTARIRHLANNNKSTPSLLLSNAMSSSNSSKDTASICSHSSRLISAPIYLEPAPIMTPLRPPPQPPISQPLPPLSPALMSSALLPDLPNNPETEKCHDMDVGLPPPIRPLEIKKNTSSKLNTAIQESGRQDDKDDKRPAVGATATIIDVMSTEWISDKALLLLQDLTERVDDLSKLIQSSRATAAALSKRKNFGTKHEHCHARLLPEPPKDPIPPPPQGTETMAGIITSKVIPMLSPSPSRSSSSTPCSASSFGSPASTPMSETSLSSISRPSPLPKDSIPPSSSTRDSVGDMFFTAVIPPLDPDEEEDVEECNADSTPTATKKETSTTTASAAAVAAARATLLTDLVLEVQREIKSCRSSITSLMSPLMSRLNQDFSSSSSPSFLAPSAITAPAAEATSQRNLASEPAADHCGHRGRNRSRRESFVNSLPSLEDFGVFQNELTSAPLADLPTSVAATSHSPSTETRSSPSAALTMQTPVLSSTLSSQQQQKDQQYQQTLMGKQPMPAVCMGSAIVTAPLPSITGVYEEKQLIKPPLHVVDPLALSSSSSSFSSTSSPLPPPTVLPLSALSSSSSSPSSLSPSSANTLAVMHKMSQLLRQLEARVALYEQEWPHLVGMLLYHDERLTRLEMDAGDDASLVGAVQLPEGLSSYSSSSSSALSSFNISMKKEKQRVHPPSAMFTAASVSANDGPTSSDPCLSSVPLQHADMSPFSTELAQREERRVHMAQNTSLWEQQQQEKRILSNQHSYCAQSVSSSSSPMSQPITRAGVLPTSSTSSSSSMSAAHPSAKQRAIAGNLKDVDGDEEEKYGYVGEYGSSSAHSCDASRQSWPFWDQEAVQTLMAEIQALRARIEAQNGEWNRKYSDLHEEVLRHMFGHLSDHDESDY